MFDTGPGVEPRQLDHAVSGSDLIGREPSLTPSSSLRILVYHLPWPGLGHYAVTSLMTKDPGPIQSFVLFVAVMYVFVNLAVDLLYGLADPRIRLG